MSSDKNSNAIVIGLSGVTNGGKTSMSEALKRKFDADVINMDDYFWEDDSPNHIRLAEFNGHANWDCVESIDFETMHRDILKWLDKVTVQKTLEQNETNMAAENDVTIKTGSDVKMLVIEGILIFNYKPLSELFAKKYFFTLTKEECTARRDKRSYEPPDPEGYFDGCVWPMHLKYKQELEGDNSIVYLNGTDDRNKLFERVCNDIGELSNGKWMTKQGICQIKLLAVLGN